MVHVVAALAVVVLTASASLAQPICPGDCNRDNRVTVAELVRAVGTSLGTAATPCGFADVDGNGSVSVAELVQAVNAAVWGCFVTPPTRTPTPLASPTPTVTRTATHTSRPASPTPTPAQLGCPYNFIGATEPPLCVFAGFWNEFCGDSDRIRSVTRVST